jgi:hypothetical protein
MLSARGCCVVIGREEKAHGGMTDKRHAMSRLPLKDMTMKGESNRKRHYASIPLPQGLISLNLLATWGG